jgi:hypothetical protein
VIEPELCRINLRSQIGNSHFSNNGHARIPLALWTLFGQPHAQNALFTAHLDSFGIDRLIERYRAFEVSLSTLDPHTSFGLTDSHRPAMPA